MATISHPGGGAAIEQPNNPESRSFGDDRPWHQRALEPELVPAPPAGASNLWPMMLRLGAVCGIAAMVAAAVVVLPTPPAPQHTTTRLDVSARIAAICGFAARPAAVAFSS